VRLSSKGKKLTFDVNSPMRKALRSRAGIVYAYLWTFYLPTAGDYHRRKDVPGEERSTR
jgi:hypothetical protein